MENRITGSCLTFLSREPFLVEMLHASLMLYFETCGVLMSYIILKHAAELQLVAGVLQRNIFWVTVRRIAT